jgi:hypothetical protein
MKVRQELLIGDPGVHLGVVFHGGHLRVALSINLFYTFYFLLCVEFQNANESDDFIEFESADVLVVELNQALLLFLLRSDPRVHVRQRDPQDGASLASELAIDVLGLIVFDLILRELRVVLVEDTLVEKLPSQRGGMLGGNLRQGLEDLDKVLLIVHVTDHAFEADQLLIQHFDLMRGVARV